jgi:alditol oxidase
MSEAAETSRRNWAGNYSYLAAQLIEPATTIELKQLIRALPRIKALGTRHSFNSIADSEGAQVSLALLRDKVIDRESQRVTVGAGVTYGELAPWLDAQGFAVANLASLPHISVAGAYTTATHGSGIANGCLSTAVSAVELVDGAGEVVHLSRAAQPEIFSGAVVSLGALGIVTSVTLDLVPSFDIAQTVYENLSFDELERNFHAIVSAGYSVSLFTDWQKHRVAQAWVKRRIEKAAPTVTLGNFFGATRQTAELHPLPGHSAENCTAQLGVPGPWYERLPHFRMDFTPSSGAELQSEYFVPLAHAYDAIRAVEGLRERITPHLFISELRTVAADDLWLSMAYRRDSLAIHFTWKPETEAVLALLPEIEARLEPFQARPHWGKLFTTRPSRFGELYPRWIEFRDLMARFDPAGRLRNDFLEHALGL